MSDEPWSFSLRGGSGYAEGEEIMDAVDSVNGANQMVDETAIDDEVDLSNRLDSAQFKSNPWTIAKLNAFNRARTISEFKPNPPHPTPPPLTKSWVTGALHSLPETAKQVKFKHATPSYDPESVRTTPLLPRDPPKVTTQAGQNLLITRSPTTPWAMRECSDDQDELSENSTHRDDKIPAPYALQLEEALLTKGVRLSKHPNAEKISEGPNARQCLRGDGPTRTPKASFPLEARPQLVLGAQASRSIHQKSSPSLATIPERLPASPSVSPSGNDIQPTGSSKSRNISPKLKYQKTLSSSGDQAEYRISKPPPIPSNCVNPFAPLGRRQGSSVSPIASPSLLKATTTSRSRNVAESSVSDSSVVDERGTFCDALPLTDLPSTPAARVLPGKAIVRPSKHADFGDDEDQLWSTLPRKRQRTSPPETPDPYRSCGRFRLPNLPINLTPASPKSPRVTLYQPPPRASTSDLATTPKWTFYRRTLGTGLDE
ncbi:hypothetical protein FRC01_006669 [Tulasnella sp. 417]|nr:hypothetical protein FRC01_006669 [Tulasnella sp. 417]